MVKGIFRRDVSRSKIKSVLRELGAGNIKITSESGGLRADFTAPTIVKSKLGDPAPFYNYNLGEVHNNKCYDFWSKLNCLLPE